MKQIFRINLGIQLKSWSKNCLQNISKGCFLIAAQSPVHCQGNLHLSILFFCKNWKSYYKQPDNHSKSFFDFHAQPPEKLKKFLIQLYYPKADKDIRDCTEF